jgi:hypothetical protein
MELKYIYFVYAIIYILNINKILHNYAENKGLETIFKTNL